VNVYLFACTICITYVSRFILTIRVALAASSRLTAVLLACFANYSFGQQLTFPFLNFVYLLVGCMYLPRGAFTSQAARTTV